MRKPSGKNLALSIAPVAFGIFLCGSRPLSAAEPNLSIAIHVYDYALIQRGTLSRTSDELNRVFREIRVNTSWLDCPLEAGDKSRGSPCAASETATDLIIRILPESMVSREKKFEGFCGFSWPVPEGFFARIASVFHSCVGRLTRDERLPEQTLLAHLMAHEIGHLLLGAGSHSPSGLMRHPWQAREIREMLRGRLNFHSTEARKIRDAIRVRKSHGGNPRDSGGGPIH